MSPGVPVLLQGSIARRSLANILTINKPPSKAQSDPPGQLVKCVPRESDLGGRPPRTAAGETVVQLAQFEACQRNGQGAGELAAGLREPDEGSQAQAEKCSRRRCQLGLAARGKEGGATSRGRSRYVDTADSSSPSDPRVAAAATVRAALCAAPHGAPGRRAGRRLRRAWRALERVRVGSPAMRPGDR
eukprot:scaffold6121_cov29-Tisochrysis_lutea.AAC.3